ncbi:MAG: alkaline phosphatase [Candidatus Heimdallarchaeota archaeon]
MPRIKRASINKIQLLAILGLLLLVIAGSLQGKANQSNDAIPKSNQTPLSVILMIGDGMGFQHVNLARWIEKGINGVLDMETLPVQLNVTTRSANSAVTDSAAAATAIATGNKTSNGVLSRLPDGQDLTTILELAHTHNKSTGILTTTEIFHATPAAFYSHTSSRSSTSEIVDQLTQNMLVDVILGGGANAFSSAAITNMKQAGYTYVTNRTDLETVSGGKILGLFSPDSIPYEQDRDPLSTPRLAELASKSLEILGQDKDGFFLMIEGGKIDWGAHYNNKLNTALEAIEFDRAVGVAKKFVETRKDQDILLIITADHETGGLSVNSGTLNDTLPSENNTYSKNKALRVERIQNVTVSWTTNGHTDREVPFYGSGSVLSQINQSIIDNTDIFRIMRAHLYSTELNPDSYISNPSSTTQTNLSTPWSNFGVILSAAAIYLISVIRRTLRSQIK